MLTENCVQNRGFIRRVYRPLGAMFISLALAGCTGDGHASRRGVTITPGLTVTTSELIVTGPSRELFEVRDPDTDEPIGRALHETSAPDERGAWTMTETIDDKPPRETGYRLDPDGALLLEWSRSSKDTDPDGPPRLYVFDPPLVLFPPVLGSGVHFEHSTRMTERHTRDESRVVLSGSARRRVQLVGLDPHDQTHNRAGDPRHVPAIRIHADLRIGVGPASAVRLTTLVYHPKYGLISELVDYSIRVLGLRFKHERMLLIRDEPVR